MRSDTYRGDGDLEDLGPTVAHSRYTLDLGSLKPGRTTYKLNGLPSVEFTIGVYAEKFESAEVLTPQEMRDTQLQVTLRTADGKVVFDQDAPLSEWTWGSSGTLGNGVFAYRTGPYQEVPLSTGDVQLRRVGVGTDGGWGTYFEPRSSEDYRLEVTVTGDLPPLPFRLVAKGGGWK